MPTQAEIIDALQFDLTNFNPTGTTANPYQITFQYADEQPDDMNTQRTGWEAWTNAEKSNYRAALDHIETLINVEFVEVTGQSDPTLNVGKVDFSPGLAGLGGLSYSYYGNGDLAGYDSFTLFNNDINMANATSLILHELGHSLGLKHPFSGSATLPEEYDSNRYTVMSYDRNPDNNQDSNAMMLYDVLALQDLWGANTDTSTGNSSYTGSRTSNMDTVWDAGGTDIFDAGAYSTSVKLDLREGEFSRFGTYEDVSIAYGTTIENARGGSGADDITGNSAANRLYGGAGDDTLSGGSNNDRLYDGTGDDILRGGSGNDYFSASSGSDDFYGGSGRDYISYSKSTNGVQLDLEAGTASGSRATGDTITSFESASGSNTGHDTIRGTSGDNTFRGYGGNDTLVGRGGNDQIAGGNGNDRLFGSSGSDKLYGGSGNDFLNGGQDGLDELFGGAGSDKFHFNRGEDNDVVRDFENNIDTIEFDNFNYLTTASDALGFADQVGSNVLFDFGADGTLLVENTTLALLSNDISIIA